MQYSTVLLALVASTPLVAAHGKIAVVNGDAGGNGTGLGIQGGVVPGPGKNKVTEVDTTVFKSTQIQTDGLGKTKGQGANTVDMVKQAMAQSGSTLPQVSSDGGSVSGTFHIVTTDGAGPVMAVVDPTGTGAFASGQMAQVMTQVPGTRGNIKAPKQRSLLMRTLVKMGLVARASNVNEDFPFKVAIPAGMTCNGAMGGKTDVCLLKVANANKAGPFGGVIAFQMAPNGGASNSTKRAMAADADDFEIPDEPDTKRDIEDTDDFEIQDEPDN